MDVTSELIRGDGLFPPAAYTRHDETPDTEFYGYPRKVVHIDDGAIAALGRLYAEVLPAGGQLLDLMSSWRTHLPRDFRAGEVIGLGLNAEEMTDNPQLTDHVVHDMNQAPWLPLTTRRSTERCAPCRSNTSSIHCRFFDRFVACYARQRPSWSLSPTDASPPRRPRSGSTRLTNGTWVDLTAEDRSPVAGDPLYAVWARKGSG